MDSWLCGMDGARRLGGTAGRGWIDGPHARLAGVCTGVYVVHAAFRMPSLKCVSVRKVCFFSPYACLRWLSIGRWTFTTQTMSSPLRYRSLSSDASLAKMSESMQAVTMLYFQLFAFIRRNVVM